MAAPLVFVQRVMADLFVRYQRLVDRLVDGEPVAAPELAAVAPLFVAEPALEVEDLALQLARLAWPEQRIPAGALVAGRGSVPGVNWPCALESLPVLAARSAAAVALLGHALETLDPAPREGFFRRVGLDAAQGRVLLESSSLRWLDPDPLEVPSLDSSWSLVVAQDVPVVDLVAPYLRDVAGSIDHFASSVGETVRGDDDRYRLLPALLAQDPRLAEERAEQEARCGIVREPSGLVLIRPAELDDRAVDLRVRNAVTALRRQSGIVVVAPPRPALIEALVSEAESSPRHCLVVTASPGLGERIYLPNWLGHIEGHLIPTDVDSATAVADQLPREIQVEECEQLVSVPACAQLRADVRTALRQQLGAVDPAAYPAALAVFRAQLEESEDEPAGAACLVADSSLAPTLGLAVWRCLAVPTRRPVGRR